MIVHADLNIFSAELAREQIATSRRTSQRSKTHGIATVSVPLEQWDGNETEEASAF
jgi:hypothetical protein